MSGETGDEPASSNRDASGGIGAPQDDVPIVEWEIPALRAKIPPDLQVIIGALRPVVRLTLSVDRKQRRKHPEDIERYERLTEELSRWSFVRKQGGAEGDGSSLPRWQVVWFAEDDFVLWPMLAVLELRRDGVLTLRSIHRRQQSWGIEFEHRGDVVKRRGEG